MGWGRKLGALLIHRRWLARRRSLSRSRGRRQGSWKLLPGACWHELPGLTWHIDRMVQSDKTVS